MWNTIEITVENKLNLEKRDLNIYHCFKKRSYIISFGSSTKIALASTAENEYLHISAVRGPGDLKSNLFIDLPAIETIATEVLRILGLGIVKQLMDSDIVKGALAAAVGRTRKKTKKDKLPEGFNTFWSSHCATLKLIKDQLNKLSKSVGNIAAVFPNRIVQLPPIMKVSNIPHPIQDNKTSSWGIEKIGALAAWGAYSGFNY
ncbi:MAG: hypothetical protein GY757_06805 [bacterium]|nr:hypothetical protein [bacterium]